MSTIKEMREEAFKLVHSAQADLNSENITAEIEARADAQLAEAGKLEARARKIEEADAAAARLNAVDTSKRPTGEGRALNTGSAAEFRTWAQDRSVGMAEREFRDQSVGSATAGGNTVPTDFYNQLTVSLIQYSPLGDPSITNVMETSGGNPLQFPLLNDTAAKGYIIGEGVPQNTANSFVFGQVTLGAYTFTNDAVRISYELLEDTGVDLQGTIVEQMGERIGRKMGDAFTTGSGVGGPTGMVTAISAVAGANSTTVSNAITFDDVFTFYHSTEPAYRGKAKFAWQMNDNTLLTLRKLKDNYGRYLLDVNYQMANEPANILGKPVIINQAMPNLSAGNMGIILGDHGGFMIRKTGAVQVQRLVERYADSRQVGYIAFVRADSNLLDVKALRGLILHA